ncbi:HET-domain-containing protein [Epithele typhae]|uniref:HET-domain-containing protein n=1 Tax=Epithele typhae TaxID=378194 RepID=UPI002008AFA1|nr:HET-domain-containing protein [Epithele typhae]KAH9918564.1 HET-domain-containing protein [Epithele typhae]
MWLLGTARANLVFFPRTEDVPGGFAILSHTWQDDEDTFQNVQLLNKEANQAGEEPPHNPTAPPWFNPRDRLSHKVSKFLERAEKAGYKYAWVDTCCIDKTSSAELTEAINSMFTYYARSSICVVYLSDVVMDGVPLSGPLSHASNPQDLRDAFKRSRWHERGWTLQELLASPFVVFFSRDWVFLGNKIELSTLLAESTDIPAPVLRFETPITDMSIATRMSWASQRVTTRPEDAAYCLFGIFGVNMPTLYGEGSENAFYRLLEEIMKTSRDPSLFLWQWPSSYTDLDALLSTLSTQSSTSRHILPSSPAHFTQCNTLKYDADTRMSIHEKEVYLSVYLLCQSPLTR